jgi:hypothetical protein
MTTQHGKGIIIAEEKVMAHACRSQTTHHMVSIAGSGAVMGSSALLFILANGGYVAASESLMIIAGATGYGLIAGVGGVTVLEFYRYMAKEYQKEHKVYRLSVKSLTEADKTYVIEQNYPRYPLNTQVKILENKGILFIRKQ